MSLKWNGDAAKAEIDRRAGAVLIAAAIQVQSELKRQLSTSFPPASRVGEFPHGRTWNLREGIVYEPTTAAAAGQARRVRIGYTVAAFYGGILEFFRGRLGLAEVTDRLKGQLAAWVDRARRLWS